MRRATMLRPEDDVGSAAVAVRPFYGSGPPMVHGAADEPPEARRPRPAPLESPDVPHERTASARGRVQPTMILPVRRPGPDGADVEISWRFAGRRPSGERPPARSCGRPRRHSPDIRNRPPTGR
jgi:hypothetical protein